MRRLSITLAAPFAIVIAGCDSTAPTVLAGPNVDLLAERSVGATMVPFKTNSYSFHTTAAAPEPGCNAAGERRVYLSGEGTATHLGRYTVTLSFCSRPGGILGDGQGTFVASNGDLLHLTFAGTSTFVPPSSLDFTSFATFTGGTGRFEGTSGEAIVNGVVDLSTGGGEGSWDGTISSVGSGS